MKLIRQSYKILSKKIPAEELYRSIEYVGRTAYLSWDHTKKDSAAKFVKMLLSKDPPHLSVLDHFVVSVKFVMNRAIANELVRHRIAAYTQESTRYCNYKKKGITFIIPPWISDSEIQAFHRGDNCLDTTVMWMCALQDAEYHYLELLKEGWTPEQARGVLPLDLKTEIVATYDLSEWKHVLQRRTFEKVHPQMAELMVPLKQEFAEWLPLIFP